MIAVLVRIASLDGSRVYEEAEWQRKVRQLAEKDSRVNHIRIRAGPHGVSAIAFVAAQEHSIAYLVLRRLMEQGIADDPRLRLWRVI
ncbi:hypothetical protein [Micromonospora sp. KLBMP9576]|uniref:hypothetical protein n=1 Tax=Micromonospora sp. KLBMP9576 TaxID=3424769 RepID=UPI003D89BEEF